MAVSRRRRPRMSLPAPNEFLWASPRLFSSRLFSFSPNSVIEFFPRRFVPCAPASTSHTAIRACIKRPYRWTVLLPVRSFESPKLSNVLCCGPRMSKQSSSPQRSRAVSPQRSPLFSRRNFSKTKSSTRQKLRSAYASFPSPGSGLPCSPRRSTRGGNWTGGARPSVIVPSVPGSNPTWAFLFSKAFFPKTVSAFPKTAPPKSNGPHPAMDGRS
mmetsp:Transcript_4021/g.14775  ORF Transcript_4021/g.14775 Transcript_4021/m.14775 type:complete len:214 (+) Transcript_4021:379-1020(+)